MEKKNNVNDDEEGIKISCPNDYSDCCCYPKLFLVDVNYFPSYAGVVNFPVKFRNLLKENRGWIKYADGYLVIPGYGVW